MSDESVAKPTIETVLERIATLSAGLTAFRESVEARFDRIEVQFHKLDRKISALNDDILEVRSDMRMLEKMIESELKPR
jgi:hypothetical protein